ncbi:uncharacterized protein LOC123532347 [Mercenaria mercenaria]|uniref:uncharacterized protein LOC123532347 n=1 Tax=Mercenaria mercenaria TaxID=6596 RepID=UPI00234FA014|nr:uncharacterized protein LOC123532347 [Mercenaria mercenaria]
MPYVCRIGFCTQFKNKSFMLALIKYVLTINLFLINCTDASSRVCRKLKHGLEDSLRYEHVQETGVKQCPPSSSPFSVYRVTSGNSSCGQQLLLVCWVKDVKRFALQFENSVHIDDVISVKGVQTRSCINKNDTIFYRRKHNKDVTFHVLLTLPAIKSVPFVFRAYYSHKNNGIYYGHHRVLQYKYSGETHKRRKRSTVTTAQITPASECGSTRNCFRNGEEGCDHFDCTYFLSYKTTDKLVDIELSAKTNGWVAVGFSSDTKMGGDEVIACRKTREDTVESGSYKNQYSHQDPKVISGDNVVTLKSFQVKDGYIYCHVSRPLTVRMSVHQDLSNDWYQLYAYGPVSSSGELEKHYVTPLVSRKISVFRKMNILTSGSEKLIPIVNIVFVFVFVHYCHFIQN